MNQDIRPIPGELNQISSRVIRTAIEVHRALGPGLLEHAYQKCLAFDLIEAGLHVQREVAWPLIYKGRKIADVFRLDLWIEEKLIVEVKAVDAITGIHQAQILTYLKMTGNRLGLLINFNVVRLKHGIKRFVL